MNGNGGSYDVPSNSFPRKRARTLTPSEPSTRSISASASTNTDPSAARARTYVSSESTATAAFETSVQGVVVQISSSSPVRTGPVGVVTGKRTYTDGSITSR